MAPRRCKLGLVLPPALHARMTALAARDPRRGALQALYADAFGRLLNALNAGEGVAFPAVRGEKSA